MADTKSRLAKLKAETGKAGEQSPESPAIAAKQEAKPDAMLLWIRQRIAANPDKPGAFDGPEWKPRDTAEQENERYGWYAIQPEPEQGYDWEGFRVGRVCGRDRRACNKGGFYAEREAIPKPRFPNPGQPASPEMWENFWREDNLWLWSSNVLSHVISLTRQRTTNPDDFHNPRIFLSETLAEKRAYLDGVWSAKNLPAPTNEQFEAWAFPEKHMPVVLPGKRLVTYTDSSGNKIYEVEEAIEPQETKPSTA